MIHRKRAMAKRFYEFVWAHWLICVLAFNRKIGNAAHSRITIWGSSMVGWIKMAWPCTWSPRISSLYSVQKVNIVLATVSASYWLCSKCASYNSPYSSEHLLFYASVWILGLRAVLTCYKPLYCVCFLTKFAKHLSTRQQEKSLPFLDKSVLPSPVAVYFSPKRKFKKFKTYSGLTLANSFTTTPFSTPNMNIVLRIPTECCFKFPRQQFDKKKREGEGGRHQLDTLSSGHT